MSAPKYSSAKEMFEEKYGRQMNMLTPELIGRGWLVRGLIAYEVSEGEGMVRGRTLVGVTVLESTSNGIILRRDLRDCFSRQERADALDDAAAYVKTLRRELAG